MSKLKDKRVIFSIITAILLFVCIGCNYYKIDSYAISTYFTSSNAISTQLFSGDVLEQEVTISEGDQGVRLLLGTYLLTMQKGLATAELFDETGALIATQSVDLTGMTDNKFAHFYFGNLDENVWGKKCTVRYTFENIDDELLAVYASATDAEAYEYTINGEVQECNVVMDGIQKTSYVEYRDFRLIYVLVIGLFVSYMALFRVDWKVISITRCIENMRGAVVRNWKKWLLCIAGIVVCALISGGIEYVASLESEYTNPMRMFAVFVTLVIVLNVFVNRKVIWQRAHIVFFVASMLIGMVNISAVPETAVSWDEQIHYAKAVGLSWGANGKISYADNMIYSNYTISNYYNIFLKDQREAWIAEINEADAVATVMMPHMEVVQPSSVAYMPTSIALYAARLLGFDFIARYHIGKLANLFMYSAFLALAIRCLKGRGKMLVAMVGLLPTNIFLASTYGYDWWVTSLTILGFSMFVGELQEKGQVSTKKMWQSVGVMCLGMMAKAVYFPILLPMMLLKKDSYENSKKARMIVVLGMMVAIISFLLPMVMATNVGAAAGGGDFRGGEQVNAGEQIVFILTNLGYYLQVLFEFSWDYLHPDAAAKYITQISYQGRGAYANVAMIMMGIAAFLDNAKETIFVKKNRLANWGGYIGIIGAVALVITALYISYTPVGAHTVNGVQARYLIPVLLPFLYFIGENAIEVSEEVKGKVFSLCSIGMSLIALNTIYTCLILQY